MTTKNIKSLKVGIIIFIIGLAFIIGFNAITENIRAGFVGYRYDRTIERGNPIAIAGTSVIDKPLTGLVFINPFTQEILKYPTTIISRNWTQLSEGDNKVDMSMQVGSEEGKNINADVYVSVRPKDLSRIISSFGLKGFTDIVDDDVYGLVKGKLNIVAQTYSIYDIQASRSEIQEKTFEILSKTLDDVYGIELIRFEVGTLELPQDIQDKIDQKTEAINAVELAKLDRQKQDEVNQKIVDQQKAESEKERLRRQSEADATAYEREAASKAELVLAENNVKIAQQKVAEAELEKAAELEKQKGFTDAYFKDKALDVQLAAVKAINPTVKTIITDSDGSGFEGLLGLKSILDSLGTD